MTAKNYTADHRGKVRYEKQRKWNGTTAPASTHIAHASAPKRAPSTSWWIGLSAADLNAEARKRHPNATAHAIALQHRGIGDGQ